MKADLDNISNSLDGEIDALNKAVGPPPESDEQLKKRIELLNSQWPTKVRLIDNLAEKTFLQLGCPSFVAAPQPQRIQ